MRAAVALLISVSLFAAACFPNNARHRTYAKLAEGGALVAGIGMLYVVNSGADCMAMPGGMPDNDCKDRATLIGNIGLGLILVGLIGFIATVSTSDDDKTTTTATTTPKPEPAPTPAPTPTPIATDPPADTPPADPAPTPPTP